MRSTKNRQKKAQEAEAEKKPVRKRQMPHLKRRCYRCRGSGRAPCQICGGTGQVLKGKDIFDKPQYGRCEGCFGTKTRRCAVCGGEGMS